MTDAQVYAFLSLMLVYLVMGYCLGKDKREHFTNTTHPKNNSFPSRLVTSPKTQSLANDLSVEGEFLRSENGKR